MPAGTDRDPCREEGRITKRCVSHELLGARARAGPRCRRRPSHGGMAPWIDPQQQMPVVIRDARALRWTAQKMPRAARGSFLFVPDGVQLQEHIVVEASNCTRRILLLFELVLLVLDSGICWQTIAGKRAEIKLAQVFFFSSTFVVMADGLMAMATTRLE
ncbi:hypothetical protein PVAP13_5KG693500 [Panicum virgatum]|uniref:Uncharacterized protein n=1 Tax=Panicum virgatum TaxID=38727 RepID=A0A8T0SZY7_PANVG|nr:hypothetical protein PVAP13_5KG693500 [Panicum virgatum]